MSYYVQVDDQEPEQVATLSGWAAVRMWAHTDVGTRSELWQLMKLGWSEKPDVIVEEVARAREAHPEHVSADLGHTLDGLVKLAGEAKTALLLSQGAGGVVTKEKTHEQAKASDADSDVSDASVDSNE